MNSPFQEIVARAKPILRPVARATLGRLPAAASRLTGALAKHGGAPVRDVRLRPWASVTDGAGARWRSEAADMFRRIFVSGVEGLPQPLAQAFAQQWAEYCGCRYGLLVTHGTDALRIALAAVLEHDGLEYGGEVIVPNYSFIASATAALDRRLGVAFVDVDPETLLLDPAAVEAAIVPGRTRAIMPVHLFGQPANMATLCEIAERHCLKIIEDAAQAHGSATVVGPAGSLGHAAGFSFQSSKNLNCGEGGALTTNDEGVYERAYSIHNAGRSPTAPSRWEHVSLGWNCRLTEYQAGLLTQRFKHFPQEQSTRAANFLRLREHLKEVNCVSSLAVAPSVTAQGMYMFPLRYTSEACGGLGIDEFLDLVRAEGAPIYRAFELTMSDQPVMKSLAQRRPEYLRRLPTPVADQAAQDMAYIPQNVFLGGAADMDDIVSAIRKVERHARGTRPATRTVR